MKTTTLLKSLIDIFFVIAILGVGIYMVTMGYAMYQGINITDTLEQSSDLFSIRGTLLILTVVYMIAFLLFTLAIFFLRKTIRPLVRKDYFHLAVSKNLKRSGGLFVGSGFGLLVVYVVTKMVKNMQLWIGVDESVMALCFVIIMGLFIRLLSEVFAETKAIKDENDLTI